jgi:uncharacterized protein YraI
MKNTRFRHVYFFVALLLILMTAACEGSPTDEEVEATVAPTSTSQVEDVTERDQPDTQPDVQEPEPESTEPVVTVKGGRVNVRSGPGIDYPVIQIVEKNDTALAIGFNPEQTWVQIEMPDGTDGWISASLVDIDDPDKITAAQADVQEIESESTESTEPIVTVKGVRVNVRSGPGIDYPIIRTLEQNDTLPATGFNSEQTWVQIEMANGANGWVSADLVDIDNSDKIATVTNIPPAPVATISSQPPPSSGNNGGSSGGNSGGNTDNPFQCAGGCATPPDPSCAIKGNVNSKGERIYHVPGGAFYNRTNIKPEEGDRWFCTTAEAQEAGFRPSSR